LSDLRSMFSSPLVAPSILALLAASSPRLAAGNDWSASVGAGVVNFPKYAGSSRSRTMPLGFLSFRYGRFFIGGVPGAGTPAGLGAYLIEDSHWQVGVGLDSDVAKPRRERDDRQHLHGLGDVEATIRGGAFASYTLNWFALRGGVFYDLEDSSHHEGVTASLEAVGTYKPSERLTLTAGPGLSFGNKRYTQTLFGVNAAQAQKSGYAQYMPQGGVNLINLSVGAQYEVTSRWSVGAQASLGRLQGDAARSPIVRSKDVDVYAVFVAYRIR
jgi:outer membrane protein